MTSTWMRIGSVTLAVGVLGALMVNAAMSSGCGTSRAAPEATKEQPSPPATATAAAATATAPSTASSAAADDDEELMGASKSGRVIKRLRPAASGTPAP